MTRETHLPTFGLSHPKNYFGVPSAIAASGDTGGLIMGHLVKRQFGTVRRGAAELGLVTEDFELTVLGERIATAASDEYGGHSAALEQFASWQRKQTRFVDLNDGEWEPLAAQVLAEYEPAVRIAAVLEGRERPLTLPEFVTEAGRTDSRVAEMFLQPTFVADESLDDLDSYDPRLEEPATYRSQATSHLKSVLFHCGLLTVPGADSASLVPDADEWALDSGYEAGIRLCNETLSPSVPSERLGGQV